MNEEGEKYLKRTVFMVEANSFETFTLWSRWANDSREKLHGYRHVEWEQLNPGALVTIGELDNRPVCMEFQWARINGFVVCFWNMCSQVTDSVMAEKWLDEHFTGKWDKGTRRAHTDACNFHHCIDAIEELDKARNS